MDGNGPSPLDVEMKMGDVGTKVVVAMNVDETGVAALTNGRQRNCVPDFEQLYQVE